MRFVLGGLMLATTVGAMATDAPVIGTVHNTKENGWLSYECEPVESDRLTCEITQVMIRKKLKAEELELKYQEAIKGLEAETKEMDESCKLAVGIVDLIQGGPGKGLPAEVKQKFRSFNAMQHRDMEQQFSALLESCNSKSMDGMRRFIRLGLEADTRTCFVSTNRFEQTFRPVRNIEGELLSWAVADTAPQGDCGFVQMSRFRPADPSGKTDTYLWQYIAKRATSNPEGTFLLGSCKGFDEGETLFDWQAKTVALQCDYIEHSPL